MQAQRDLRTKNLTLKTLPYEEKGMEAAAKIWTEFEKARWKYEIVRNEDQEADEVDEGLGYGELENMNWQLGDTGNRRSEGLKGH